MARFSLWGIKEKERATPMRTKSREGGRERKRTEYYDGDVDGA